jgi:hypothetical protein
MGSLIILFSLVFEPRLSYVAAQELQIKAMAG